MMPGEQPAIPRDEYLYRRIPLNRYQPRMSSELPGHAFNPSTGDINGLSVSRASLTTIEEVARGRGDRLQHVCRVKAGAFQDLELEVVPDPLPNDPGHCLIPAITIDVYRNDKMLVKAWRNVLAAAAEMVLVVLDAEPPTTQ